MKHLTRQKVTYARRLEVSQPRDDDVGDYSAAWVRWVEDTPHEQHAANERFTIAWAFADLLREHQGVRCRDVLSLVNGLAEHELNTHGAATWYTMASALVSDPVAAIRAVKPSSTWLRRAVPSAFRDDGTLSNGDRRVVQAAIDLLSLEHPCATSLSAAVSMRDGGQ